MKALTATTITVPTATGTLTSDNTNVSNGDTVTIGNKTYTFKTALTPTEGEVLIGANADASLLNLINAINHTGADGTAYKCAARHTQVSAATSVTSHAFAVTSLLPGTAGNAYATTETSSHLSWGAATLTGGADTFTITGTFAETTFTQPAQQTTISEYPALNASWTRNQRLTDAAVFCIRNGGASVALLAASWSKIAAGIEPLVSWAPKFTLQPAAASCVHSSTAAVFTVTTAVELSAAKYQWQYSADGGTTWMNATGTINGCVYTGDTTASLTCTPTTTGQSTKLHRCVAWNNAGSTNSTAAALTIT